MAFMRNLGLLMAVGLMLAANAPQLSGALRESTLRQEPTAQVDAFNPLVCGGAKLRVWQEEQSAFGCKVPPTPAPPAVATRLRGQQTTSSDHSAAGGATIRPPGIVGGQDALEGEFPFHASLLTLKQSGFSTCGATLIHNNLLLTAAHCVVGDMPQFANTTLGVGAYLGTNHRAPGSPESEDRFADRWCYPRGFLGAGGGEINLAYDLALVRLSEPLQYKQDKIQPACLPPFWSEHSNETLCAFAGLGHNSTEGSSELPELLQTLQVRRGCDDEAYGKPQLCYMAAEQGERRTLRGDSGSPVVCYDQCALMASTRAFVVAVNSWGHPGENHNYVVGVSEHRDHLVEMLEMVSGEGYAESQEIICEVPSSPGPV